MGLVLVPVCLFAALREWQRWGWSLRPARRAFLAPVLSLTGLGAFLAFLWAWTGNPLATYIAQHHGWSETTTPLSLWRMAEKLAHEIDFNHFNQPTINLNLIIGLIGGVTLALWLGLVYLSRREISPRGDPVDPGDRVPRLHVLQRAAAAAHAHHRVPGADGRRPLRARPLVPGDRVGQRRAAGRAAAC